MCQGVEACMITPTDSLTFHLRVQLAASYVTTGGVGMVNPGTLTTARTCTPLTDWLTHCLPLSHHCTSPVPHATNFIQFVTLTGSQIFALLFSFTKQSETDNDFFLENYAKVCSTLYSDTLDTWHCEQTHTHTHTHTRVHVHAHTHKHRDMHTNTHTYSIERHWFQGN